MNDALKRVKTGKIQLENFIDKKMITQGMKYALATGNWGQNRIGQVLMNLKY